MTQELAPETYQEVRKRYLRELNRRPGLWLLGAFSLFRYLFNISLYALVVMPCTALFGALLMAGQFDLVQAQTLAIEVLQGADLSSPASRRYLVDIWLLCSFLFAVVAFILTPYYSPLERRADDYMADWTIRDALRREQLHVTDDQQA